MTTEGTAKMIKHGGFILMCTHCYMRLVLPVLVIMSMQQTVFHIWENCSAAN